MLWKGKVLFLGERASWIFRHSPCMVLVATVHCDLKLRLLMSTMIRNKLKVGGDKWNCKKKKKSFVRKVFLWAAPWIKLLWDEAVWKNGGGCRKDAETQCYGVRNCLWLLISQRHGLSILCDGVNQSQEDSGWQVFAYLCFGARVTGGSDGQCGSVSCCSDKIS